VKGIVLPRDSTKMSSFEGPAEVCNKSVCEGEPDHSTSRGPREERPTLDELLKRHPNGKRRGENRGSIVSMKRRGGNVGVKTEMRKHNKLK